MRLIDFSQQVLEAGEYKIAVTKELTLTVHGRTTLEEADLALKVLNLGSVTDLKVAKIEAEQP